MALPDAERYASRRTRWRQGLDSAIICQPKGRGTPLRICALCRSTYDDPVERCAQDGSLLLALGPGHDDIESSKYVVLGRLGVGGMSKVYRAYKPAMEKEVALKVLSGSDVRDPELVERFRREATNAGQLRSAHTVRVYDFGWLESGEPYIEMELLSGASLETIIQKEAPLHPDRVADLVYQICLSLEEAHARGRVHRDIKPSNIMIEHQAGREHATVLDFGLVKHVGGAATTKDLPPPTDPQVRAGTPLYMAPELWSAEYGSIGPGADIYALGIVMFQMLTGKRPFPPATEISRMIAHHLYQAPAPLSTYCTDPAALERFEAIIARCLSKRPADRFASISDIKDAIAPPPAVVARPQRPRSKLTPALSAGAFLALACSTIVAALQIVDRAMASDSGEANTVSTVMVESDPPKALIFIDGEPTGLSTPGELRGLSDERVHQISLSKQGYGVKTTSVAIDEAEKRVFLRLEPDENR
jgi:serine/threonine-protein kinase